MVNYFAISILKSVILHVSLLYIYRNVHINLLVFLFTKAAFSDFAEAQREV